MFEIIKNEKLKRWQEEVELKKAVEEKRKLIQQKRDEQRKGIGRKIKFVDNIYSKREQQDDAAELSNFRASELSKIQKARIERKKQIFQYYKKYIIFTGIVMLILVAVGISADRYMKGVHEKERIIAEQNIEAQIKASEEARTSEMIDKYTKAIEFVACCNYKEAYRTIDGLEYEDSAEIKKYVMIQIDIDSGDFDGNIKSINDRINSVNGINNSIVNSDYIDAKSSCNKANNVQSKIDKICLSNISSYTEKSLNECAEEIKDVDSRYTKLLDTEKYNEAKRIRSAIESKTKVGKLIIAISKLDINAKWKKLEKKSNHLLDTYEELSEKDKADVVNYYDLVEVHNYVVDKREKYEKREKKKAKEKKKAEERKKQKLSRTVYITRTGRCYHLDGCSRARNSFPVSYQEAINKNLAPCQVCNPDSGW